LFQENAYIAHPEGESACVVVDPGLEPEKIVRQLDQDGLTPLAVLNTHGHSDHIAGNGPLKERWPDCRIIIGQGDAAKLTDPNKNLSAMFGIPIVSPPADQQVTDGESFTVAGIEFSVREIPGHSVGHVVYVAEGNQPAVVFAGDVIFAGSIGRTDFPDGNFDALAEGIRGKLYQLPDDTRLLCGHGPETTVGREKRSNPFVSG
jgi:glyoxylase-like metal-dependent hydrolase (beta-lactamase superfamily II)